MKSELSSKIVSNTLIITAVILFNLILISASDAEYSWWLKFTLIPSKTAIESIPVNEISPAWAKAEVISHDILPPQAKEYFAKNEVPKIEFTYTADLNQDGQVEKIMTGVFLLSNGKKGRFLLVLDKISNDKWKKSFLKEEIFSEENTGEFSAMIIDGNKVKWTSCLECGAEGELSWENGQYIFKVFAED